MTYRCLNNDVVGILLVKYGHDVLQWIQYTDHKHKLVLPRDIVRWDMMHHNKRT